MRLEELELVERNLIGLMCINAKSSQKHRRLPYNSQLGLSMARIRLGVNIIIQVLLSKKRSSYILWLRRTKRRRP